MNLLNRLLKGATQMLKPKSRLPVNDIDYAVFLLDQQIINLNKSIYSTSFKELNPTQLSAVIIFTDILYMSLNCLLVLKQDKDNIICLPMLIRSMLEYAVDLMLLTSDESHRLNMLLNSEKEDLKFFNEAKKHPPDIHGVKDLEARITQSGQEINTLKNQGAEVLRFNQKLDALTKAHDASFDLIYLIYRKLCAHSHPQLRMMSIKYEQKEFKPFSPPSFTKTDYLIQINFISQILLFSLNEIHTLFEEVPIKEVQEIADQIKKIAIEHEDSQ